MTKDEASNWCRSLAATQMRKRRVPCSISSKQQYVTATGMPTGYGSHDNGNLSVLAKTKQWPTKQATRTHCHRQDNASSQRDKLTDNLAVNCAFPARSTVEPTSWHPGIQRMTLLVSLRSLQKARTPSTKVKPRPADHYSSCITDILL